MISFLKKTAVFIVALLVLVSAGKTFAANNITSPQSYSQFLTTDLDNSGTNDFINWAPANGGATVSDTGLSGTIWGETVGWINLAPTHDPVTVTCGAHPTTDPALLGGYAWGQNTGWINFAPTRATGANRPQINPVTGKITGTVWAQNYGYIQLSSLDVPSASGYNPSLGLVTSWHGCSSNPVVVNGVCGSANGASFSSSPVGNSNLCSAGNLSGFSSTSGGWSWSCLGSNGGTDATTCSASQSNSCIGGSCNGGGAGPSLTVITHVINSHGGTAIPSNFNIYVKHSGSNIPNSPASGVDYQGRTYGVIDNATYTISQDAVTGYTASFSGDCNALGDVSLAVGFSGTKTCTITESDTPINQLCQDSGATNYGAPLPCHYYHGVCSDTGALNFGQALPCTYPGTTCQDTSAINDGGSLPCRYPPNICQDPAALNNGGTAPCQYPPTPVISGTGTGTGSLTPITAGGSPRGIIGTPRHFPLWLFEAIALVGLASTIPGLISRFGSLALAFAFDRKKRRGIVYDSATKEPLDPAYVSLINATTGQEIQSQITDLEGRYGFILQPGTYKIVANKTHYQFPSTKLAGHMSDQVYDNLYFGEVFTVTDPDQVVIMNIPMDAIGTDWNQTEKRRMSPLKYLINHLGNWTWLFEGLFIIGFLAALVITYFNPIAWNIVVSILYVVIAVLQMTGFGPVTAGKISKNGMPLPYGIVHIYNKNLNREIARKVTTPMGGYYALVPKADYYVTIDQKSGDDAYVPVYTSDSIKARDGIINKSFRI